MRVCYFGTYDPDYTRNKINLKGLKSSGIEVVECRTELKSRRKYIDLWKKHRVLRGSYDVMVVGFAGHAIMPLAWLLTRFPRKSLVLDMFVSEYDSVILDRRAHRPLSFAGIKYWIMDWLACQLADVVLLEAQAHCDFFISNFHQPRLKFRVLNIGCDEDIFYPRRVSPHRGTLVHFHGSYSPVQGVKYILDAAKLLRAESITFRIVGKLKNYHREIERASVEGLTNCQFIDLLPYGELAMTMSEADICLGMFGDTPKAQMTSAFKIIEAMALGKPCITADTPAMREFFIDRSNILFCKSADGQDLAKKILEIIHTPSLSAQIAAGGQELYRSRFTSAVIGGDLAKLLQSIFTDNSLR